jgi:hypothetical protein
MRALHQTIDDDRICGRGAAETGNSSRVKTRTTFRRCRELTAGTGGTDPAATAREPAELAGKLPDEAPGIRAEIWDAIEGARASGNVRLLALGNPREVDGLLVVALQPGSSALTGSNDSASFQIERRSKIGNQRPFA